MFDTYAVRNVSERVHETRTIHEHRAPTDESVRLLREMEKAAQDKVIQSVRLENCGVDAVLHHRRDVLSDGDEFLIVYKLNGQRRTVTHKCHMTGKDDRERIALELRDALAQDIATVLTGAMLGAAGKFREF